MTEADCDEILKSSQHYLLDESCVCHRTCINTLADLGQYVTVHHRTKFKRFINCTI